MVDERSQRLVAVEADAVQVGGLALVPAGCRREVDDRGDGSLVGGARLEPASRRPFAVSSDADERAAFGRVEAGEAPAVGQGARRRRRGRSLPRGALTRPLPAAPRRCRCRAARARRRSARGAARRTTPVSARDAAESRRLRRGRGGAASPTVVSIRAWARPRKPSASSSVDAAAAQVRPAWKPPATISTSLAKSGKGGRPASAPSETPIDVPSTGWVRAMPVTECPADAGLVSEERHGSVEAERLGDRVRDDVDGDAGERERCREADAERDDAHVLEARVGEQPLPGERPPEERHRDGEGDETEADEDALRRPRPRRPGRATAPSARRRAAPREGAPRRGARRPGGGASACASGSQLCTGAQPIFAARPASSSM